MGPPCPECFQPGPLAEWMVLYWYVPWTCIGHDCPGRPTNLHVSLLYVVKYSNHSEEQRTILQYLASVKGGVAFQEPGGEYNSMVSFREDVRDGTGRGRGWPKAL